MYDIFKATSDGLVIVTEFEEDCWVRVSCPTNEEINLLSDSFGVPPAFLTDPLDIDESARVETDESVTLIIVRIPFFEGEDIDIPYTTIPLGIILTDDYIITVSTRPLPHLLDFVDGKVRTFSHESRARFLLQIFSRTALLYLRYLKDINKRTDLIERELHKSLKNEELIKLLNLEKSLVYFTTSVRSNEIMMERIDKTGLRMSESDRDTLEDVIIENKQAIEMANIYSNILSGMMDAFASIISNNMNVVIKFLTAVTIVLTLPTVITSFYGMNVRLPLQEWPIASWLILGVSLIVGVAVVFFFLKRDWM